MTLGLAPSGVPRFWGRGTLSYRFSYSLRFSTAIYFCEEMMVFMFNIAFGCLRLGMRKNGHDLLLRITTIDAGLGNKDSYPND